jgi:hypothetical protein
MQDINRPKGQNVTENLVLVASEHLALLVYTYLGFVFILLGLPLI